jgi:hypothetical protein
MERYYLSRSQGDPDPSSLKGDMTEGIGEVRGRGRERERDERGRGEVRGRGRQRERDERGRGEGREATGNQRG